METESYDFEYRSKTEKKVLGNFGLLGYRRRKKEMDSSQLKTSLKVSNLRLRL